MNIYSEMEKYVKSNFSGTEEHHEVRLKIISMPKDIRKQIRDSVRPDFSTSQAIEWYLRDRMCIPNSQCYCGKNIEGVFCSLIKGYRFQTYCSTKCRSQDAKFKEKIAKTNNERYGHINNMWGAGVREETKERWIKKFGVDNPLKCDAIKTKVMETNQSRWGISWPGESEEFRKKMVATCIQRYGEDDKFLYSKAKATSRQRYGVDFPMQVPEIFERTQKYKRKESTFPSGQSYSYQGYENVAIELLLEEGIKEGELIISSPQNIPVIEYWNPVKNRLCHYFPDIWIPSRNLLIEVKSTYTLKKHFAENFAKQAAARNLGFEHQIWVCNKNKLVEVF